MHSPSVIETQVLIIGGGVTGTALARDLALRGVDCVLVEKDDINAGASGRNHGLLHSGARYVAGDREAAMECRAEGELLKRMAAQTIQDTGGYFVAVSLVGVCLLVTEALGAAVECARAPVVLRALVAVMALGAFSRQRTTSGFLAPEFSDELVAAVRGGYARGPDGVAHLLLLEDTDLGDRWGVPAYRHLMTTTGTRSELLEVVFPERPMRVSLLSARHRPWMSPRPGDLVLRVTRQGPRGDVGYVNRTRDDSFHVVRERAPAAGDPVPEALRAGDAGLAPGLAAAARAYWAARSALEWAAYQVIDPDNSQGLAADQLPACFASPKASLRSRASCSARCCRSSARSCR